MCNDFDEGNLALYPQQEVGVLAGNPVLQEMLLEIKSGVELDATHRALLLSQFTPSKWILVLFSLNILVAPPLHRVLII